jgi:hypothetical protein
MSFVTRVVRGSRFGSFPWAIWDRSSDPIVMRVTMPAKDAANARIGEAVTLKATLQPPREPIEPGGFDFGRQAWFASLGATGYATSKIESLNDARAPPWDLAAPALEDDCRSADIVIAPFTIGKSCRAARVIVDRRMLRAEGAYALYVEGLSIRAESVAAARGRRPWVPDRAMSEQRLQPRRERHLRTAIGTMRETTLNAAWAATPEERGLVAADQADEAPLHPHAVRAKDARLVAWIGCFERDGIAAPAQAL